jgi:hypothetical protein
MAKRTWVYGGPPISRPYRLTITRTYCCESGNIGAVSATALSLIYPRNCVNVPGPRGTRRCLSPFALTIWTVFVWYSRSAGRMFSNSSTRMPDRSKRLACLGNKKEKGSADAPFTSFSVWGSPYAPVIYYPERAGEDVTEGLGTGHTILSKWWSSGRLRHNTRSCSRGDRCRRRCRAQRLACLSHSHHWS